MSIGGFGVYMFYYLLNFIVSNSAHFYFKLFNFISRIRILPVLLLPIFLIVYIINFIYRLLKKELGYKVYVKKIGFSKKFSFTKLTNSQAKNNFIEIIKK